MYKPFLQLPASHEMAVKYLHKPWWFVTSSVCSSHIFVGDLPEFFPLIDLFAAPFKATRICPVAWPGIVLILFPKSAVIKGRRLVRQESGRRKLAAESRWLRLRVLASTHV